MNDFPLANDHTYISFLIDKVAEILKDNQPVYLVGGAVRDLFWGNNVHDLDFAVPFDVFTQARKVADALSAAYYPMDDEHGTARVIVEQPAGDKLFLDFSQIRGGSIQGDLGERDFTLNAMAIDIFHKGVVIDPLNGAQDLKDKLLQVCSQDSINSDPIRVVRGIRLAVQYKLKISENTSILLGNGAKLLQETSPERIRDEFFKLLDGYSPKTGIRLLHHYGCLETIIPELLPLQGVEQSPPHIYPVWEHTLDLVTRIEEILGYLSENHNPEQHTNLFHGVLSLYLGRYRRQIKEHFDSRSSSDHSRRSLLLFAALLHDAGKPQTRSVEDSGRIRFFEHEQAGEKIARRRARELRLSNQEIDFTSAVVRGHMRPLLLANEENPPTSRAIYRFFRKTGDTGVDICIHALGDTLATYGHSLPVEYWEKVVVTVRSLLQAYWESPEESVNPPALLSGSDLIKKFDLNPGPIIGKLLEEIRLAQIEKKVIDYDGAIIFVEELLQTAQYMNPSNEV